jgi:hypothetical protein
MKLLIGKIIKNVEYITKKEASDLGTDTVTVAITFNDGSKIISYDPSHYNGVGALYTNVPNVETLPVCASYITQELIEKWNVTASKLNGLKVSNVRMLSDGELDYFGWTKRVEVIILEDNQCIIPMSDDEGNESGEWLFLKDSKEV